MEYQFFQMARSIADKCLGQSVEVIQIQIFHKDRGDITKEHREENQGNLLEAFVFSRSCCPKMWADGFVAVGFEVCVDHQCKYPQEGIAVMEGEANAGGVLIDATDEPHAECAFFDVPAFRQDPPFDRIGEGLAYELIGNGVERRERAADRGVSRLHEAEEAITPAIHTDQGESDSW